MLIPFAGEKGRSENCLYGTLRCAASNYVFCFRLLFVQLLLISVMGCNAHRQSESPAKSETRSERPLDASQHRNDVKASKVPISRSTSTTAGYGLVPPAEKLRPVVPFDNKPWRSRNGTRTTSTKQQGIGKGKRSTALGTLLSALRILVPKRARPSDGS